MHFLLKCINATTAFKLRIENGEVVEYDKINISPTIGREDGTFGFGFFEYDTDLSLFIENAEKEIHRVKNSTGLSFPRTQQERMSSVIRLCPGLPFPR